MNKNFRVICDLDNILNSLTKTLLAFYNKDSGDNLQIEDITKYKIDDFTKPEFKITDYFKDEKLWMALEPISQAQEYLKILNQDYDLRIVTASHPKYHWIKVFYPFLKREQIWTVFDKQWIDCDILIDDCLDNIGGNYRTILLDYPWNRNIDEEANNVYRAYNFEDIFMEIKRYELPIVLSANKRKTKKLNIT